MSTLTRALAGGAAPSLQYFYFNEGRLNEDDVSSLADMVEARARIPECKGLKHIDGNHEIWFAFRHFLPRSFRALCPTARSTNIHTTTSPYTSGRGDTHTHTSPHVLNYSIGDGKSRNLAVKNAFAYAPPLHVVCIKNLLSHNVNVGVWHGRASNATPNTRQTDVRNKMNPAPLSSSALNPASISCLALNPAL